MAGSSWRLDGSLPVLVALTLIIYFGPPVVQQGLAASLE